MRIARLLPAALAAVLAAGCDHPGCLRLTRPSPLLAEPVPLAQSPRTNHIVAPLKAGEYHYQNVAYTKENQYFELHTPRGSGYLVREADNVAECR